MITGTDLFAGVTRHSDLRDITAALSDAAGAAKHQRYLTNDDPGFLDNEVKAAARRAWRRCYLVMAGSRMEETWDRDDDEARVFAEEAAEREREAEFKRDLAEFEAEQALTDRGDIAVISPPGETL